ncbi:7223_t:CDS:2, partial [Entrophospora sp. SA101]
NESSSITPELSNNKRKHAGDRPLLEKWDSAYPSGLEIHLANQCIEFQHSFVVSATNRSFGIF